MIPARAFLFAGGGTGGHIFPGLAIAEQIRRLTHEADPPKLHFACSQRAIDRSILTDAREAFTPSSASPFGSSPKVALRFLRGWGRSLREARALVRSLAEGGCTVEVIAMGGFVAAPFAQAARAEHVPLTLVNLDAVPGRANRWIGRLAARAFTTADAGPHSWVRVPPVVRSAARAPGDAPSCRRTLGLEPARPTLLISGGSQGARTINALAATIAREPGALTQWQVVHQTGPEDAQAAETSWREAGITAVVRPFFDPMGICWGAADLALARAGAGSVAEAWANAVPTLFLPYPFHKDGHQRANALPLERSGAAVITQDLVDPDRNAASAGRVLQALLADAPRRDGMRQALRALGPADGAERIARELLAKPARN